MLYWLSWHQPTEDYRPLTDPPHERVLGWWCTGYDENGVATLCALVEAMSDDLAKSYVQLSWPEAERWRFCNECGADLVLSDRFVLKPWMKERMAMFNVSLSGVRVED